MSLDSSAGRVAGTAGRVERVDGESPLSGALFGKCRHAALVRFHVFREGNPGSLCGLAIAGISGRFPGDGSVGCMDFEYLYVHPLCYC